MGRERAGRVVSGGQSARTPRTLLVRMVGCIRLEGLEELESEPSRGGVVPDIDDKLDIEESDEGNLGRDTEEVIGGLEAVDEILRGIRGNGAPALLALREKRLP